MDFATARMNMVESQIRPNGVTDLRILNAMLQIPREAFVPPAKRGIAYLGDDLEVAPGRHLIDPMIFAKMADAADIRATDTVLDVGCASGYSTAVLARLAETVIGLECDTALVEQANSTLSGLGIDNAVVVAGPLHEGYPQQAPYDVIFLNGAVEELPESLKQQLKEGGRLLAILSEGRVGRAMLFERTGNVVSGRSIFDGLVAPLPGFRKERGFVFE